MAPPRILLAALGLSALTLPPVALRAQPSVPLHATAPRDGLGRWAAAAVGEGADATDAQRRLRAAGPRGLEALESHHAEALALLRATPTLPLTPELTRLREAYDAVSGQRDGHASQLYFYDDLALALVEARARGVPVLSLRMLGRLTDELSCANSRYFRTLVYPDPAVSRHLRDHFVLHVSMERPAPRITIDMGDGRTLVRTITGNSAHYVLDTRGRVVDVIPGLYAPSPFVETTLAGAAIAHACGGLDDDAFAECLAGRHAERLDAMHQRYNALQAERPALPQWEALGRPALAVPEAERALQGTIGKMIVEAPMYDAMRRPPPTPAEQIDYIGLADAFGSPVSPEVRALLRLKLNDVDVTPIARTLATTALADALRNEWTMHRHVHGWYIEGTSTDFAIINARVYAELFATPADDPWLGLRSRGSWDAIERLE